MKAVDVERSIDSADDDVGKENSAAAETVPVLLLRCWSNDVDEDRDIWAPKSLDESLYVCRFLTMVTHEILSSTVTIPSSRKTAQSSSGMKSSERI